MKRKHNIPLGTIVAFEGDSICYKLSEYQTVLECPIPCDIHDEGDCYEEPYVHVTRETGLAFPISKLKHIFDHPNGHSGREATEHDKALYEQPEVNS